jgi:hypothetical protein
MARIYGTKNALILVIASAGHSERWRLVSTECLCA